jgi:hypothetical protein
MSTKTWTLGCAALGVALGLGLGMMQALLASVA